MRMVGGKFHGTGATVYICHGFVPDFVWLINIEDIGEQIIWNKYMTLAAAVEGFALHDVTSVGDQATGEGIRPYYGGDTLTTTTAGTTTYGEGVYLVPENKDWRWGNNKAPGGGSGEGASENITKWTLDTSANRSGHFDEDVISTATHIAAGSEICIDGKWYVIESVTAGTGEAADEVVLNESVKSGDVQFISGCYGYTPLTSGKKTPAGFSIRENTHCNANGQMVAFMAGCFDN